ncbi:MAG: hypothetical protein A3C44_03565 [Gammaproteobacteria bacterium RIFCSPHIGHO2_02_FULL_39_13]|nr:MAG: hypothetical protein A3C44_03565 [Gammaproteobacteria bacterium RIFCSPHIGHO2_02_FULL_39_13]OGT49942.1 MAG: hypothetical protein A3E53_06175 [Gammaproteobacteria bacterium RIFCSPHIGHO2_12_FULL_39_24]
MNKLQWIRILILFVLALGLTACYREPNYIEKPEWRSFTSQQKELLWKIQASGIQIIKQGMYFTFIIPTDCFFTKDARELKPRREIDLDRLAQFLNRYATYFAHPKITINGYTDKVWLAPARNLLSLHYAETIATYLREDGLDSKIVLVVGNGAKHPVGSNNYPMGASFNRRVVVTIP